MTKGKKIYYIALLVIFTVASMALLTKGLNGRISLKKAEQQCPYIRITDQERQLLEILRELPQVSESFETNAEVASFIEMDMEQGREIASSYLPQGAEVSDFSTYSRTVLIGYLYNGYRINMTMDGRSVVEKTVAEIPAEGEGIKLVYVNNDNQTITRHNPK